MNGFLEKTTQNLNSAKILLDQCHYSSSVHCSFYGCLQTALHILFVKLKHNKSEFEYARRIQKQGTHQYVFDLIKKEVKKNLTSDYHWFRNSFSKLKTLREQADYSEEPISQSDGHDAFNKATAINNLINKLS